MKRHYVTCYYPDSTNPYGPPTPEYDLFIIDTGSGPYLDVYNDLNHTAEAVDTINVWDYPNNRRVPPEEINRLINQYILDWEGDEAANL